MKKNGFSLAEVLITIAIVGAVASLAIPALITKTTRQSMASKLSSTVSDVENGIGSMMVDEDKENFYETPFGVSRSSLSSLKKYLNYSESTTGLAGFYGTNSPFSELGGTADSGNYSEYTTIKLRNGAIASFSSGSGMFIDVNGEESPNKWGRDVFDFTINNEGSLLPAGNSTTLVKNNYRVNY